MKPLAYHATALLVTAAAALADPLPSWKDTDSKKAIVAFVEKVTTAGSPEYVVPAERIATFDNDGMVEHDDHVGMLLDKLDELDELGIADNTIVIYSTDNGAEMVSWPDGGITPFKGEKGTTWEGGFRIPLLVKWPGVIKPGTKNNDIISHEDWIPTLMAAVGEPDIADKLKKGHFAILEGNITNAQRVEPSWPIVINLKADPYEHAWEESGMYLRWMADNMWLFVPVQGEIQKFLMSMDGFPFQEGQSLNAGGINYQSLKALKILEQIREKGIIERPGN